MKQMCFADAEYAGKRKQTRAPPDQGGSGGALEGVGCFNRAILSKGRRGASGVSVDGHVTGSFDAKLVRLQRTGARHMPRARV